MVHNKNTIIDVKNIFGCMYLLWRTCAQSSFAYSLVLNPREKRDSGIVVVLDFEKITYYEKSNVLKQNVLCGVQFWPWPELCWLHRWPWRRVSPPLSALPVWAGTCREHLVACWSTGTSFLCAWDKPGMKPHHHQTRFKEHEVYRIRLAQMVDLDVLRFKPCLTCLFLWILKKVCWTYRSAPRQSFQSWSGFILDNRRKLCIS